MKVCATYGPWREMIVAVRIGQRIAQCSARAVESYDGHEHEADMVESEIGEARRYSFFEVNTTSWRSRPDQRAGTGPNLFLHRVFYTFAAQGDCDT